MKKIIVLVLVLVCAFFSVSCSNNDVAITGDGKMAPDFAFPEEDSENLNSQDSVPEQPVTDEMLPDETETDGQNEEEQYDSPEVLDYLSANEGQLVFDGEYYNDAELFAQAVVDKNYEVISTYTGGLVESYGFLEGVTIEDYTLVPFAFSDEKLSRMEDEGFYTYIQESYYVTFNVTESDRDEFPVGKCVYYMGFIEIDPIAGNRLEAFVPADETMEAAFVKNMEYTEYFIKEFTSFYSVGLSDGKYQPYEFDFMSSVHLITHLMARSGRYNDYPPYTLEEINSFIADSFEDNKGIEFNTTRERQMWMAGVAYEENEEEPERVYGCALGHGGTTAMHRILSIENVGNLYTYTVEVYADYAYFAKAKTLEYVFEMTDGNLPKLISLRQTNSTGNPVAVISV